MTATKGRSGEAGAPSYFRCFSSPTSHRTSVSLLIFVFFLLYFILPLFPLFRFRITALGQAENIPDFLPFDKILLLLEKNSYVYALLKNLFTRPVFYIANYSLF